MTSEADQSTGCVLPDNLLDYAWGGRLPKKVYQAYRLRVILTFAAVVATGLGVGLIAFGITGNQTHLNLAVPISTWLASFTLPVIYGLTTRDVRILRPDPHTGRYFLDTAKWFVNADDPFHEADCLYENGLKRVLWLIESPDGEFKPFDPWDSAIKMTGTEKVTTAQVAGIEAYADSVRTYAFKKNMTMIEQLRLGFVVIAIVALLLGIFIMSGRLTDDPAGRQNTPVTTANAGS